MIKKYLYAVRDKKAEIYDGYMILDNHAQATRSFAQACEKNEVFNRWPEDFELHLLGEIHMDLGAIIPCKEPEFIASALSFVEKKDEKTTTSNK